MALKKARVLKKMIFRQILIHPQSPSMNNAHSVRKMSNLADRARLDLIEGALPSSELSNAKLDMFIRDL